MSHPLLKAFSEKPHAESFCNGSILLRSTSYYRGYAPPTGDRNESTVKCVGGGGSLNNNTALLCFHDPSVSRSQYGKFFLKIHDAHALLKSIEEKIFPFLHVPLHLKIDPVKYYDVLDHCPTDASDIIFHKIKRSNDGNYNYEIDKEWRMVFFMKCVKYFTDTENVKFKYFKRALYKGQYGSEERRIIPKEDYCDSNDLYYEMHISGVTVKGEIYSPQ